MLGEDEKAANLYEFEGEDYKKKQGIAVAPAEEFIDIGQRERRVQSYDVEKYYRDALNIATSSKEKKKLRGWRLVANGGYDHQFFENDKLDELEEKEQNYAEFLKDEKAYLDANEGCEPPKFSKKDVALKEKLLAKGFGLWSKKDFY